MYVHFFFVCLLSTSFVDFDSLGDIFNLQINVFVVKISEDNDIFAVFRVNTM
jgi:hypothetical protein